MRGSIGTGADYQNVCAALYREVRLLGDRQQDAWLEYYVEDTTYWMLAWDDDGQLTDDPHSQISLMHYANRCGLEDRASRIKTEHSSASTSEPRASRTVTSVEVLAERGDEADVCYDFHTLSHRHKTADHFFSTMFVTLHRADDGSLTVSRKTILKNDYTRQVLNVYHV